MKIIKTQMIVTLPVTIEVRGKKTFPEITIIKKSGYESSIKSNPDKY